MKQNFILLLSFIFMGLSTTQVFAQKDKQKNKQKGDRKARMEKARVNYITEKLDLNATDSVAFWNVYSNFETERKDIRKEINQVQNGFLAKSDAQLSQEFEKLFDLKEKEIELEKKYYKELQSVISERQIAVLLNAEKEIRKEVLKRMSGQQRGGQRYK
ncbi:hypothetical protein [Sediminitomix flava]|uniref:LTXXQ motif family protein n=1 Tax=Sediminitomix flava TaxID=379075 RepID=A0A315Z7G3_SEDFL|nr:hypothetical protein [Sediminitomix flava]PWJ40861.1 hypothetical protein BC781_104121 [Sediminitomix flava]